MLSGLNRAMQLRFWCRFESCVANGSRNVKNKNLAKQRPRLFCVFGVFAIFSKQGSTPTPWARRLQEQIQKGRSRHRKSFMHRVYSARRGIETMVSEGARPWGSRVVADVWEKDVWEFQAKSGSSCSCRLFLHFLGKNAVREMSGKTPGSPRRPSCRHPRPSEVGVDPSLLRYQVVTGLALGTARPLQNSLGPSGLKCQKSLESGDGGYGAKLKNN